MEQSATQITEEQILREHVERAKSYGGTIAAYCREHNLDYEKFMYCRKRMRAKTSKTMSGFAKVQAVVSPSKPRATSTAGVKNYPQLPDPKWLAELIHGLAAR